MVLSEREHERTYAPLLTSIYYNMCVHEPNKNVQNSCVTFCILFAFVKFWAPVEILYYLENCVWIYSFVCTWGVNMVCVFFFQWPLFHTHTDTHSPSTSILRDHRAYYQPYRPSKTTEKHRTKETKNTFPLLIVHNDETTLIACI